MHSSTSTLSEFCITQEEILSGNYVIMENLYQTIIPFLMDIPAKYKNEK